MSGFWPKASPAPDANPIIRTCGNRLVSFNFYGLVDGVPYESSVAPATRQQFMTLFDSELVKIEKWFFANRWLTSKIGARPALGTYAPQQVFELDDVDIEVAVSPDFAIERSLVPASVGRRGAMEFPNSRVAANQAAITHELSHVYFPNGNRLLAEGFGVYIQNKIGANGAFPDFGTELHDCAREFACQLDPNQNNPNPNVGLAKISIAALDKVQTPAPLELLADPNQDMDPAEAAYRVAGSFVKFLIERGKNAPACFQALFFATPLKPLRRDAGLMARWKPLYGESLANLEKEWKALIAALGGTASKKPVAKRKKLPR